MRLLNKFVLSAYLRGGHPPILGSESPLLPLLSESNLEGRLGTPSLHARFSRHVRCQCELSDRERVPGAHTNLQSITCFQPEGRDSGKVAYFIIIRGAVGR